MVQAKVTHGLVVPHNLYTAYIQQQASLQAANGPPMLEHKSRFTIYWCIKIKKIHQIFINGSLQSCNFFKVNYKYIAKFHTLFHIDKITEVEISI